jgi:DNA polymerase III subunit delta
LNPEKAAALARKGELLPLYVIAGEERFLRDRLVAEIRAAALGNGPPAFNEDRFTAGENDVDRVLSAARTVPMMAARRFIMVRSIERWESASADGSPYDKLAAYAENPVPSTCLVLVGDKVDGRRKLIATAKKKDFLVDCAVLGDAELVAWVEGAAESRGNPMSLEVAESIARLVGPDLATVNDAIERLSLYAGAGAPIDESAVRECVARVRMEDTWSLVDAIGRRDLGASLRLLADVYDPRDRGLPLVGALAWSFRQLFRLKLALAAGSRPDEAARKAGIFQVSKVRELTQRAERLSEAEMERWLVVLAATDRELKSSRRPADATLESMILQLGQGGKTKQNQAPRN